MPTERHFYMSSKIVGAGLAHQRQDSWEHSTTCEKLIPALQLIGSGNIYTHVLFVSTEREREPTRLRRGWFFSLSLSLSLSLPFPSFSPSLSITHYFVRRGPRSATPSHGDTPRGDACTLSAS